MRTRNSIVNITCGLGGQVISIITQFVVRTVFIYQLGVEYLGINGLFINILSILSLAELGVGNAIIFSLYKPLSENNMIKVKALMQLYKKAYRIIGLVVLGLGISVVPFLNLFISTPTSINENITNIYLLFLMNSVISYMFAYKRSLIIADQKEYIVTIITNCFNLLMSIVQVVILYTNSDFVLYLVIQIIFTLLNNIYIGYKADKIYPILKDKEKISLDKEEKSNIIKNVKALLLYKIGTLLTIGLDNIIISGFVGVVMVGIYSNYTMLMDKVNNILTQIFNALTASVGNLNAGEDISKKEFMYKVLLFLAFWLYGVSTVSFYVLLNPFVELWVGKEFWLSDITTLVIVINFYLLGMNNPTMVFRNTLGLYVQGKYRPIIGAIINLVVSLLLVGKIGILGVVLGTLMSRLLVLVWYEPYIIYKNALNKSVLSYYLKYIVYTLITIITTIITTQLSVCIENIVDTNGILLFISKIIICVFVPNILFCILNCKTKEFRFIYSKVYEIIIKFKAKLG